MSLPLWLAPNLLSLDAPLIAVLWQGFIAACFHVSLTSAGRAALGLAVWAVYIADRLLDSRSDWPAPVSSRHRFHQEHRRLMIGLLVANLVGLMVLAAFQAPAALVHPGAVIAGCVLCYFLVVHRARGVRAAPKEILVALVFASGTVLAPWTRTAQKAPIVWAGAALFFACLANTVAIEAFEWRRFRRMLDESPHPVTLMTGRHYTVFCCALLLACGVMSRIQPVEAQPVLLASALAISGLLMMFQKQRLLSPDAFRVLADAALLSPVPIWLLWRQ